MIGLPLVAHLTIHWAYTNVGDDPDGKRFAKVREGVGKWLLRRGIEFAAVWCIERSVGLSTATRKASVSLAERDGDEVVYVSARLKDVVSSAAQLHGWNQPAGVNVNIANIPMPTEEERAEIRALDAKLDALAAKLKG